MQTLQKQPSHNLETEDWRDFAGKAACFISLPIRYWLCTGFLRQKNYICIVLNAQEAKRKDFFFFAYLKFGVFVETLSVV